MKRILVFGLKDPAGGVENAAMAYIRRFSPDAITADFAVFQENFSLTEEIENRGGRVFFLPDRIRARARYRQTLDDIFQKNVYDAVWCHFSGLTNIDVLKYAKKYGVKTRIAHAHTTSLSWSGLLMRFLVPVFHTLNKRKIDRYATGLWACSKNAGAFMYGKDKDVRIIPNAVETARFAFSEENRQKHRDLFSLGDAPVYGHVGRMCVAKNQRFLLEIFKQLLALQPDARLLFVGDGELHDEVHAAADALGVTGSVVFTGARGDVPELLSAMDVFLLPSVTEGFPVTLVEAQVNGLRSAVSAGAVTEDVSFTDGGIDFIPLTEPTSVWAERAKALSDAGRMATGEEDAERSGFDIASAAKTLEAFFLND